MSISTANSTGHTQTPTHIFLLPLSEISPQSDITNNCSATIISRNQPSPVSNLTTTNQVGTDINNDHETHLFETSRKHNHSTPGNHDTDTITTPVHTNAKSCLCQLETFNSNIIFLIPFHLERSIFIFGLMGELPRHNSVPNDVYLLK